MACPEHFTLSLHYEETPLCDRKEKLYDLRRDDEKAEFLRDAIAFANSARSFGKPARILFGIDNAGNVCGLGDSLAPYEDAGLSAVQVEEKVREAIGQAFAQYIKPELSRFNFRLEECAGKPVSSLIIHPVATRQRFHVKRRLASGRQTLLHEGQCWIRFGEHKELVDLVEISADDQHQAYWYAYAEIPYILPSYWLDYFSKLQARQQVGKAREIIGYQEPLSMTSETMLMQIQRFLDGNGRVLIIEGEAGIGKTAFLLRQIANLIENNTVALREIQRSEEFRGPPDWIPIWYPLRNLRVRDCEQLTKRLLDVVHESQSFWTGPRPSHPEHLFEYPDIKWLICLDGLDEIWSDQGQRDFLGALHGFLKSFPLTKVIVTTRPESVRRDEAWLDAVVTQIAPLTREMILNYVASSIREEASGGFYQEVVSSLSSQQDLWRLCSFPVCLEAAMKELADIYPETLPDVAVQSAVKAESLPIITDSFAAPIGAFRGLEPVKVDELVLEQPLEDANEEPMMNDETPLSPIRPERVVDFIYARLWQREIERNTVRLSQAENWRDKTGKLALCLDGQHQHFDRDTARRNLGSDSAIFWLLNLGILDRMPQMQALAYRTEMTKAYFAARYMQARASSDLDKTAHQLFQRATPDFRQRIYSILEAISTTDLSQFSE